MDLAGKGISRDTISAAWQEWEEQGGEQDEMQMIHKLLEKRHFNPETADFADRQKQMAFLMRKGFQIENIRKMILDTKT